MGAVLAVCPRHRLIARFERGLCRRCFDEAVWKADDKALEDKLAAMRLTSADALLKRLGGSRG